jgi:hypothetical protein
LSLQNFLQQIESNASGINASTSGIGSLLTTTA